MYLVGFGTSLFGVLFGWLAVVVGVGAYLSIRWHNLGFKLTASAVSIAQMWLCFFSTTMYLCSISEGFRRWLLSLPPN